jgi:PAS domain S-box-containing protein
MSRARAARLWRTTAQLGIGAGAIAAVTAASFALELSATAVAFFYLIVIELLALTSPFGALAVLSVLAIACLNVCFVPPVFTLHVEPLDAVELAAFLATALVTTHLVTRSRRAENRATERARLLDLTHDATYVRDLAGRIVYWSGGAEALYGWTAERALGRVAHELLHTAFPVPLDELTAELDRTGHWQGELGHTTRDGTRLVVNARWALERDADGRPVGHLVATNDISARKQVEAALQASEARFRTLVDHATDAFFLQDEDGTVIDVNRQACESLGYTREEMVGSRPRESVRELDRTVDDIVDARMPASGGIVTFETRHRRKDGTEFPVEVRVRQFVSDGRRFRLSLVRDVTERHAADQALRDSEERYRALIEVSPQAVWIAGPDGAMTYFNQFMSDYSGFTPEQVLGHAWLEKALHPEHRASVRAAWLQAVATGRDWDAEIPLRRADGEYRWHVTRGRPIRDAEGTVVRWVGVAFDIHDRRAAEDALQRARDALMHVTRVATVGEVTGSLAHELNQPLAAIVNNANACLTLLPAGRPDLADVREALEDIVGDAERAAGIIDRVRALLKRTTSERLPVRLADVVADVMKLTAAESAARHVVIRVDVPDDLPLVLGDRVQLQQMLLNLVVNGMDAMRDVEPPERTLDIRGRLDDGFIVLSVVDRGPGLSADQHGRIFEAFYTTKPEGIGLGLAICRSIVEAHGGRLSAETTPGRGARFTARLPATSG